jgi:hypothetical protein
MLGVAGCSSDGSDAAPATASTTTEATTTTATASTTSEASTTTSLPTGTPMPGCEQGWTTPEPGSDDAIRPLQLILGQMGVEGELEVVDLRMFAGPEVPWILEPRPDHVDWWYVKARLAGDPTFAGRWIVARRAEDRQGIDAVAPFDSQNYESPDWRAFEGDGAPRAIEGLPGEWGGLEYDFVFGDGGATPGLPEEVELCLEGT